MKNLYFAKYIAYDANAGEMKTFDTFESAKKWLIDDQDFSDEIPSDFEGGFCWGFLLGFFAGLLI